MTDPRATAFVSEATRAVHALGINADRAEVGASTATFDFHPDDPRGETRFHVVAEVGLDDGRILGLTATSRTPEGPSGPVALADLPDAARAGAERLRAVLAEVAARHYPAAPAMTLA